MNIGSNWQNAQSWACSIMILTNFISRRPRCPHGYRIPSNLAWAAANFGPPTRYLEEEILQFGTQMYIRLFSRVLCMTGKGTRVGYRRSEDWIMSRLRQPWIETILSYGWGCFIVKVRLSAVTVKHRGDLAVHGGETMEYEGHVGLYYIASGDLWVGRLWW